MDKIDFPGTPANASHQGAGIDQLLIYVHVLMAALFVGWLVYFLYCLVKFRAGANPKADYVGVKSHISTYLEGVIALIEAVLLIGFAIPLWAKATADFPKESEATTLRIVGQQFGWNARYPGLDGQFGRSDIKFLATDKLGLDKSDPVGKDDFVVYNDIVIPNNKPVVFHISSMDVIHGFAVHSMRAQQDAMHGLSIPMTFTPAKEGTYLVTCAQLCGNGHGGMRASITVKSQAEYDKWFAEKSKGGAGAGSFD